MFRKKGLSNRLNFVFVNRSQNLKKNNFFYFKYYLVKLKTVLTKYENSLLQTSFLYPIKILNITI